MIQLSNRNIMSVCLFCAAPPRREEYVCMLVTRKTPISTTHASDAVAAVRKLVTCAMEAGPHVTHDLATSKLAATIDLIVQLDLRTTTVNGVTQRRRRVAEVIALAPGERETGYATTHIFAPDTDGTAHPVVMPDEYRSLERFGFDLSGYLMGQETRP